MKTIAFFVPQYHQIPLNDKYWGEGFTEWVNVKNSKPLFEGHKQPKVPLNNNYYNLLDRNTKLWQMNLAKEYGIYGFCYYHYWFNGEMLLEKPCEQILGDKEIDLPFCFCWANEAWTMEWAGKKNVIMPQFYGEKKEWKEHFDYLLKFFRDERYIKEDGKPLLVIYRPESIPCLTPMLQYWRELAKRAGFPGMVFMNQSTEFLLNNAMDHSELDYEIEYEPQTSRKSMTNKKLEGLKEIRRKFMRFCERHFGWDLRRYGLSAFNKMQGMQRPDYDAAWKDIITRLPYRENSIPCAFVDWDNSPRYHERGQVYIGAAPEKFRTYFSKLIERAKKVYKKDYIFIFAWNEWGEGGYLEPDEENKYGYLEAVRDALKERGEFPW
ncbi:MAG: glycoside hydrolase family 99-like domain-containing protein [Lachnospiraceae bacterium]|nr:glycoside hydrolase family 99-like domain-containing protein [Lachnospiraceae bacterium]